jgi:hypothetical protein
LKKSFVERIVLAMNCMAFWTTETGAKLKPGENLIRSPLREDRHPSFSVNTDTGLWHDFGTGQGGDAVSFVMLKYGMSFPEAKKYLERPYKTLPDSRGYHKPQAPKPLQRIGTSGDYCLLEIVRNGIHNRGTFEKRESAPDYFTTPGATGCYHSMYRHSPEIISYHKRKGSLQGYSEPVWLREMISDVDFKIGSLIERITKALFETRKLFKKLHDIGITEIRANFSGSKGFHLRCTSPVLDTLSGFADTPARTEALARRIAEGVNGLDFIIYRNATRLIRSVNSINSKSGLYAIPLTEAEIFLLAPVQIIDLAKAPRRLASYPMKMHSRVLDGRFVLNADGSVLFEDGTDYTRDEMAALCRERDKKAIKGLHLIKTIFKGELL